MRSIIVLIICGLILGAGESQGATRELTKVEKGAVVQAIKGALKDPTSPLFKWPPYISGAKGAYCGLVNAKNSFGGYVGFSPYEVLIFPKLGPKKKTVAVVIALSTGDPTDSQSEAVTQVCAEKGYIHLDPALY